MISKKVLIFRELWERSGVSQLDQFQDSRGILCFGGRLKKSNLNEEKNLPVIHPKKSAISNMIMQWGHQSIAHR